MAQPALQSFKRRGFAIKAESTEGTDSVPTSASNAFRLFDGQSSLEQDVIERPVDKDTFGHDPFVVNNQRVLVEGDIELIPPTVPGDGTNGLAACRHVLFVCGMAQTLTLADDLTEYDPISVSIPSASMYFWHSGTVKRALGVRGDLSGLMMAIGDRFKARVRLQGSYDEQTEEALPSDFDYSAFTVPTVSRKDNSIMRVALLTGGYIHLRAKSLSVDLNNELQTKEYTQFGTTSITDRRPTAVMRFARQANSDINFHSLLSAGTYIRTDYTITDSSNNYSRLKARGQIEQIQDVEIDGDFGYEVTLRCIPSDDGNDEFGIEFGTTQVQLLGDYADGENGVAYSSNIRHRGVFWTAPVYSVQSGSIPTGTSLNTATGEISGTPNAASTYNFTIRATWTDSAGATQTADSAAQSVTTT